MISFLRMPNTSSTDLLWLFSVLFFSLQSAKAFLQSTGHIFLNHFLFDFCLSNKHSSTPKTKRFCWSSDENKRSQSYLKKNRKFFLESKTFLQELNSLLLVLRKSTRKKFGITILIFVKLTYFCYILLNHL